MADLTKMVEDWYAIEAKRHRTDYGHSLYTQAQILKAMAAEIEGNREKTEDNLSRLIMIWDSVKKQKKEIEKLKTGVRPVGTVAPDYENIKTLKVERDRQ